jgi:ribosomal protein S18 acetylase RimI-like enzyme
VRQRYPLQKSSPTPITIRPAVSGDAGGIASIFLESAEYHAGLDPELYLVPALESIAVRYRDGRQHSAHNAGATITLVAAVSGEVAGFVDARLERIPDPMHRAMIYCSISEIAVARRYQNQSIGGRLLRAAEDWGRLHGAEFAFLEYHTANVHAGLFYQQRMGYRTASITAIKRL